MNLTETIKAAHGEKPVDLLITNAQIVNVFAGEIVSDAIAISEEVIVGFGQKEDKMKNLLRVLLLIWTIFFFPVSCTFFSAVGALVYSEIDAL